MILWRHQWVPKVAAQRKIRHPPPRLLLSNSTSPLIIQSSTSRASTQVLYGNFVISVARRSFYLSLYAVLCGINTRCGGVTDRKRIQTKGLHNEALRCRGVRLCGSYGRLHRAVTHLQHELVLYYCHWGTGGTRAPMSHLSSVYVCMCASFLCEQSDEINIMHTVSGGVKDR